VPAALGHLGSALAGSVLEFALARGVCGLGYAVVTIACQAHLAQIAQQGRMARSLGGFTGAVMTGALCGTAIGAVIADRIGYRATFGVSVALVLLVQLLAWRVLEARVGAGRAGGSVWRDTGAAFRSPGFVALVLLAAVPAKLLLAGFIFYLAPLELQAQGLSQAAIGRNVMLYALSMLPAIALGAWLSDRARWEVPLIWLAGLANGIGLLLPLAAPAAIALPAAIVLTGLAQGFAAAPMLALVPQIAARQSVVPGAAVLLAFLRLGERLGSVAGPLVAAWLLLAGGAPWAMAVLGLLSIVTALGYAVAQLALGRPAAREAGA
jgi:predicted MFS family arabinose efflux permease